MTRRRLTVAWAVLALGGVRALPAVHWRLVGWWWGEPLYQGRPASYWAVELRSLRIEMQPNYRGSPSDRPFGEEPADAWPLAWAKRRLGYKVMDRVVLYDELPFARPDPAALPVLRVLSADPNEGVSG